MAWGLKSLVSTPVAVVGGAVGVGIVIYALTLWGAPEAASDATVASVMDESAAGDAGAGAADTSEPGDVVDSADVTDGAVADETGDAAAGTAEETRSADNAGVGQSESAGVDNNAAADDAGSVAAESAEAEPADGAADGRGTAGQDAVMTADDDAAAAEDETAQTEAVVGEAAGEVTSEEIVADTDAAPAGIDEGGADDVPAQNARADATVVGNGVRDDAAATEDVAEDVAEDVVSDPGTSAPEVASADMQENSEDATGDGAQGADGTANALDTVAPAEGGSAAVEETVASVVNDATGSSEESVFADDTVTPQDVPDVPDVAPVAEAVVQGLGSPDTRAENTDTQVALLDKPDAPEAPADSVAVDTQPEAAVTVTPEIAPQPQAVVAAPRVDGAADALAPKFDLVRVDKTGGTVVAGRAEPNTEVEILQNGQTVATVTASARGEFVALFNSEPSAQAQSLELAATPEDGGPQVFSEASVIVLGRTLPEIDAAASDVVAALPPAVIQATPEAVTVLQPVVGLADLDGVSLDSISYDAKGEVVLAGRGHSGNTARAYVDGDAQADRKISENGSWRIGLTGLEAGRYVLRIDEIAPDGAVVSRVESPFQRVYPSAENLEALGAQRQVVIQRGDNLWNIARVRYGDGFKYSVIYDANVDQIRDPDMIFPGQIFDVPNSETGVDDQ